MLEWSVDNWDIRPQVNFKIFFCNGYVRMTYELLSHMASLYHVFEFIRFVCPFV